MKLLLKTYPMNRKQHGPSTWIGDPRDNSMEESMKVITEEMKKAIKF